MNILFVTEKPYIGEKLLEAARKNDSENHYYVDYVQTVLHVNDNFLLMREHDGCYYRDGKKADIEFLKLDSVCVPDGTFFEFAEKTPQAYKNVDLLPNMDKIVCACDPDRSGFLSFLKYVECNNLDLSDMFYSDYLDCRNLETPLKIVPFSEKYDLLKLELEKANFESDCPRKRDVAQLRNEAHMKRTEFAEYFKIPYHTIENWEANKAACADYLYDLMEYKLVQENKFFECPESEK